MTSSKVLASLIEKSNGKMITVTFVKKNGDTRVLNGRLGVTKYLKGTKINTSPAEYITIFDVKNNGYRSINRENILGVRCDGIEAVAVK